MTVCSGSLSTTTVPELGEYRAGSLGNPRLSDGYVFVSCVLSGEHRRPSTRRIFNVVHLRLNGRGDPPAVDSGRAHIWQVRWQLEF